jgi:anti-sigma factor RsiW
MTDPARDPSVPLDPERLVAFLDGELPAAEAREVAARIASDPSLAREVEEHRAVWKALAAYRDEPVPAGFADRAVAAALAEDAAGPRGSASFALLRGGRGVRVAAIAASMLAAVGVGMALGRGTAPRPEAPPASVALDAIPEDVLAVADVDVLANLSDEDFEVILAGNPEDLADAAQGG